MEDYDNECAPEIFLDDELFVRDVARGDMELVWLDYCLRSMCSPQGRD